MWKPVLWFLFTIVVVAAQKKVNYDGYKVYRLIPVNENQLQKLKALERARSYDFWKSATNVNQTVDVMVSPKKLANFQRMVEDNNFLAERTIEDVQKLINAEQSGANTRANYEFSSYPTLQQIYDWMDTLPTRFGNNTVKIVSAGNSYQGRPLKGVVITFTPGVSKRVIFLEGGIHAREWISPATVMYMVENMLSSNDPTIRAAIQQYDWHVFPVFNPDGYKYSWDSDRLWRKNRQPWTNFPLLSRFCVGTDLNRNWAYHWRTGTGSSGNPCAETYAGNVVFSTPEARNMANYIALTLSSKLAVYLSFHSYGQYILLPYGDSAVPSENAAEANAVATAAANTLKNRYGTQYQVGTDMQLLKYYTNGASSDWVKYSYKTPIVLSFELRDTNGFLLPSSKIIPTGQETLDALITIVNETAARGYK